jgi:hypothetical protein
MIYNLDPNCYYSNRAYLTQWFYDDIMVIVDTETLPLRNELYRESNLHPESQRLQQLIDQHSIKQHVIDVTHNVLPVHTLEKKLTRPILTNDCEYYYRPQSGVVFFPVFLWGFSLRNRLWQNKAFSFDAGSNKVQEIMCLNNRPRWHRTWLWAEFNRLNTISKMTYSFANLEPDSVSYTYPCPLLLPGEEPDNTRNDVGVDLKIYHDTAVNLVTETSVDDIFLTEKTCKPFMARQIPIIVCGAGTNKFLADIGLDMFEDIVPWQSWDSDSNNQSRLEQIASFVDWWVRSGTIMGTYQDLLPRIERNKQYFHSEAFRQHIMTQMNQFKF